MATCIFLMIGGATVKPDTTDEVESIEMFVDGQVNIEASENGRYQSFNDGGTLYMIDTRTGGLYHKKANNKFRKAPWVKLSGADWEK